LVLNFGGFPVMVAAEALYNYLEVRRDERLE
jgi:hypothetical protein